MSIRYSLDSIVVRGHRFFGWGFCLDEAGDLRRCAIEIPLEDGQVATFEVLPGGYREDLVSAFPGLPHAGGAGFMVNGLAPASIGRGRARMLVTTRDGREMSLPLDGFPDAFTPATDLPLTGGLSRIREIARARGWFAAMSSAMSGVAKRLGSVLREVPRIESASTGRWALVVDHSMGGGANRYREGRITALRAKGNDVLLVVPELATLSYRVLPSPGSQGREGRYTCQRELLRFLEAIRFDEIEVNNLVGFEDPAAFLGALVRMRREGAGHLRFQLHDFHAACPSFTLIDAGGKHCGVPEIDVCRRCLPANARNTLGMHIEADLLRWREAWASFLDATDEIIVFSRASSRLLVKVHPAVDSSKIKLEPHALDPTGLRPVSPKLDEPMCIAAVGHLNHAKGAGLVRALASRAAERQLPLRFVVVGTLEGGSAGCPLLRVTGKFSRESLCDLLEAEGAGIALLPSICPETYSYVVDEIMAIGLPLAVLDVGAPPERVTLYPTGLVLPTEGVDAQLDALVAFARRLGANS